MKYGRSFVAFCALAVTCFMGCCGNDCAVNVDAGAYNGIVSENGLMVVYPNFTKIDLVCGTMPSKSDTAVILVVEAAYTEAKLRTDTGVVELHPKEHEYCTNWITFYK